jgi:HemY protein
MGARGFLDLGANEEAATAIEKALEHQWNSALLEVYPDCTGSDPRRQLERAESWLKSRPRDSSLLLALGRICVRASLWGKARSYLEASLAIEQDMAAHLELARLLETIGESDGVRVHLGRALSLAMEKLTSSD